MAEGVKVEVFYIDDEARKLEGGCINSVFYSTKNLYGSDVSRTNLNANKTPAWPVTQNSFDIDTTVKWFIISIA